MSETPPDRPGKAARNEKRKAAATTFNALSVGGLIAVLVQFGVGQLAAGTLIPAFGFFVAAQIGLYYILDRLED